MKRLLTGLFAACESGDALRIREQVQAIVPEYAPYSSLDGRKPVAVPAERPLLPLPRPFNMLGRGDAQAALDTATAEAS